MTHGGIITSIMDVLNFKNYPLKTSSLTIIKKVDGQLIERIYQQRVQRKEKWFKQIYKDILRQLSGLKEKGLVLGIISNCTEEEEFR